MQDAEPKHCPLMMVPESCTLNTKGCGLCAGDKSDGLTVDQVTFTRGMLDGKPCVVIYDTVQDKTSIISWQSKDYAKAMAALTMLEVFSVPNPNLEKKTVLHAPKHSRIIRPGMQ